MRMGRLSPMFDPIFASLLYREVNFFNYWWLEADKSSTEKEWWKKQLDMRHLFVSIQDTQLESWKLTANKSAIITVSHWVTGWLDYPLPYIYPSFGNNPPICSGFSVLVGRQRWEPHRFNQKLKDASDFQRHSALRVHADFLFPIEFYYGVMSWHLSEQGTFIIYVRDTLPWIYLLLATFNAHIPQQFCTPGFRSHLQDSIHW